MANEFEVREVAARETVPLRHAILRPHQPIEEIYATADEPPGGCHFAAFRAGAVIGVASLYPEPPPGSTEKTAWRLRGMAVVAEHRKRGVGRALVLACLAAARDAGVSQVWCNARATATAFYERSGFTASGAPFELPGIGPHFLMEHRIGARGDPSRDRQKKKRVIA